MTEEASIIFDDDNRRRLAQLADVLIPAGDGMPSASQVEVAGELLDAVLAACPDLAAGLSRVLSKARARDPATFIAELRESRSPDFDVLAEFTANAYFLNPAVRQAIGYGGQQPRPIDPHPDYLDDELLETVIRRGPIYRPTPRC